MPNYYPRLDYNGTDTLDYYTTANPFFTSYEFNPDTGNYEWLWMPNCTAYAFGRWNELAQEHNYNTRWPLGDGESWYSSCQSKGYPVSQTLPLLGAAMCWTYNDGSPGGHVAIIEEITYDSNNQPLTITTSNSAWNGYQPPRYPQNAFPWFYLEHISMSNLNHHTGQLFLGFCYHPDLDPAPIPQTVSLAELIAITQSKKRLPNINIWKG